LVDYVCEPLSGFVESGEKDGKFANLWRCGDIAMEREQWRWMVILLQKMPTFFIHLQDLATIIASNM